MSRKDDLGERMKTYYEQVPKTRLMRRVDPEVFEDMEENYE